MYKIPRGMGEAMTFDYDMLISLAKQKAMLKCPTVVSGLSDATLRRIIEETFASFDTEGEKTMDDYLVEAGDKMCGWTESDSNGVVKDTPAAPKSNAKWYYILAIVGGTFLTYMAFKK
jgi:hypothetical protein